MGNALAHLLKSNDRLGKGKTMTRAEAARRLDMSIREITLLGRQSRMQPQEGHLEDIVCFSKAGKHGGLFLATVDEDLLEQGTRLRREAMSLLVELKGLSKGLSIQLNQGKLFEGLEEVMPHVPDEEEGPSGEGKDDAGSDDCGEDSGAPSGTP